MAANEDKRTAGRLKHYSGESTVLNSSRYTAEQFHRLGGGTLTEERGQKKRRKEEDRLKHTAGVPRVALLSYHNERVEGHKSDATTIYVVWTVSTSNEGTLQPNHSSTNP